ncbi:MAG: tryptophan--tRNA ligase [Rickettsiales bacterium]|jgi:tryptophanyl-tRNA synthetase|nr:tryptophan--tRNA ligase [Rickettsiales bacterium]
MSVVLTGDRPSGSLHIGHYVGSLKNRVEMQNSGKYDMYIMSADIQALTDNYDNPKKIQDNVFEVVKDNIAVGIDPKISTLFIQSQIQELTELTILYMNLVTLPRLERNPTVKTEIAQKAIFNEGVTVGFLCYPVSQAADITFCKGEFVPVGDDQAPMIEQTNEIVRKFNRLYKTDILKECQIILSQTPRLKGLDGSAKMSKSLGNAIYLKDDEKTLREKIMSAYTDPNHIKISDKGQVEGNMVFEYLAIFHPDKKEVENLKNQYEAGGLGDVALKNLLFDVINTELKPIRERRAEISIDEVKKITKEGTEKAREIARKTLNEVRKAVGINYFDNI